MTHLQIPDKSIFSKFGLFILLAGLTFASCDTVSEDGGNQSQVTLRFQTTAPSENNASLSTVAYQVTGDTLTIDGTNGTLVITEIRFIVDDFELEKAEGECESLEGKLEDDCEEFEAELLFIDLPLTSDSLEIDTSPVKTGVYEELEFEIDDLDLDEEEDTLEQQQKAALLSDIRTEFPDWPKSASMVISGSFTSNRGDVTEFSTYAEAEVSIEIELNPPLEIQNNAAGKFLTVNISPVSWFTRGDGSVINLANFDYSTTQEIIEFEAEIKNGFQSIEVEDD